MKKFRFLEWKVYNDAQDLFKLVLRIVRILPKEYRFELGSQIIRASLSIILNIAEGSGKTSDKELARFLDISLGSAYEVLASADVLRNNALLDKKEFDLIYSKIVSITDQLGGFKQKIKVST
jgi:four helix bundle protein